MTIEEKYNIYYFNNKRYYKADFASDVMLLQDTIPYCFEYKDIKIYESAWNRLTVKILEMLDEINPLSEAALLGLEYPWSHVDVFSTKKKTNFLKFKDIYINTNHTATHSGMSIRFLMETYGCDLKDCILCIRRHPIAEPSEVRNYYREQTKRAFRTCLMYKGKSQKNIDTIISNIDIVNKFLVSGTTGFDDFFLFEDYQYFCSYKQKTLDFAKSKYYGTKNYDVTEICLDHLEYFYKKRDIFLRIDDIGISDSFKEHVCKEIEYLFRTLKTNIISASKLYARMTMIYEEEMGALKEFNNLSDFYSVVEIVFKAYYYFNKPFITNDKSVTLSNDDIIMNYAFSLEEFSNKILNDYISKMHLSKFTSYLEFMKNSSDYYVQVDMERMVRKENVEIDDCLLNRVTKEVNYYINSFGQIDTRTYMDYKCLPILKYQWNKYLLVGIVRSFLGERFVIEDTSDLYKKTEFLINKK